MTSIFRRAATRAPRQSLEAALSRKSNNAAIIAGSTQSAPSSSSFKSSSFRQYSSSVPAAAAGAPGAGGAGGEGGDRSWVEWWGGEAARASGTDSSNSNTNSINDTPFAASFEAQKPDVFTDAASNAAAEAANAADAAAAVANTAIFEDSAPMTAERIAQLIDNTATDLAVAVVESTTSSVGAVVAAEADKPGMVAGLIMQSIEYMHVAQGLPYWEAIILVTALTRVALFPVALKTVQGAARMSVMRPEMTKIQDLMAKDSLSGDQRMQARYTAEMQALFVKHDVNPLRSIFWPLAQFPVFIAFFWALRDMGTHYPGLTEGGMFWFENLSAADPYMILPIFNSLSFLVMIEIGSDGMPAANKGTFKWAMRGMAGIMVPATMSMPAALFLYWGTNNTLSILQTFALKQPALKAYFNIPDVPAEPAAAPMENPFKKIGEALARERAATKDAKAEILDGVKRTADTPPPPPPITFARRPIKAVKTDVK